MISLLVPTRNRPKEFLRFYNSAMGMADKAEDVEVVAYIDEDDTSYERYEGLPRVKFIKGPRVVLSEMWNVCWRNAKGPYFGHMGDDIEFKSRGWDTHVKEAIDKYPGKIAFVWGNDMAPSGRQTIFGTHGFVHENWTNVTKRFVPPYFSSDYNDTWFNDVAEALEVGEYLPQVVTDHLHFVWGKATKDKTTLERLARHEKDNPEALYFSPEMEWERNQEAFELRKAIEKASGKRCKLSILIATIVERGPQFQALVERTLAPQVKKFDGEVEIIAYWNNGDMPLAKIRQALVDEARGDYICFVDDDDMVPGYYVEKILEALETEPDYVGWRMQAYIDEVKQKPTFHSLRYKQWHEDDKGFYRNASHLNPIRRSKALKETFKPRKGEPEDVRWASAMVQHLKKEVYIKDIMYYYHHNRRDSKWQQNATLNGYGKRPVIKCPSFRYHPDCPMAYKFDIRKVPLGYTGPGPAP